MKFSRDDLGMLLKVAETVYDSGVCPPDIKNPKACFAVMLAGAEFDLGPMQSLRSLQVVKGKIGFTADFTVAQCLASPKCKYFRLVESTDKVATYETLREGDPEPTRLSYTIQQAQRAGLTKNDTWSRHTEAMLRARCAAALARAIYPDRVAGVRTPDEVEEIETLVTPSAVAQLPPPARPEKPVEAPVQEKPVEQSAQEKPAEPHPALASFYLRLEEVELPGESVAVWLKHREELKAAGADVVAAAWKALCEHTSKVGKMARAEVWLNKAIAEEDARGERLAPTVDPRPAEPPVLVIYRQRCAAALSLAALVSTCLELASTVQEHKGRAWEIACARARELDETPEELTKQCAWGAGVTKDPAVWRTTAAVLVAIDKATTREQVTAAVKQHAAAVAAFPAALKDALNELRASRIKALSAAPTDTAAQIEEELKRAQTIPDLDAAAERIERELKSGKITADQAKALVSLHEQMVVSLESGLAA